MKQAAGKSVTSYLERWAGRELELLVAAILGWFAHRSETDH